MIDSILEWESSGEVVTRSGARRCELEIYEILSAPFIIRLELAPYSRDTRSWWKHMYDPPTLRERMTWVEKQQFKTWFIQTFSFNNEKAFSYSLTGLKRNETSLPLAKQRRSKYVKCLHGLLNRQNYKRASLYAIENISSFPSCTTTPSLINFLNSAAKLLPSSFSVKNTHCKFAIAFSVSATLPFG